jgi:lipoprotein-anchoring transpeptidase ErfK/SrfK
VRTRTCSLIAVFIGALLVLAGGAMAYDHAHRDTIAKGITVRGIDVGGLTRAEAIARLRVRLLAPLQQPVRIDHGSHRWTLSAREARVSANIDATVDAAIARSRQGVFLARATRELTGGKVHAELTPRITYSDAAITRVIARASAVIDRPSKNATLTYTVAGPKATPGVDGLAVDRVTLRRKITALLRSPETARRRVSARTHRTAPAVTTANVVAQAGTVLVVDRERFRLTVFKELKRVKSYSIAVGAEGLDTPAGLYHIQNKAVDPAWTQPFSDWVKPENRGKVIPGGTPENPLKARWLGIFDGAGIHGVDPSEYGTIGHAASHGCVRMRIDDVVDLYPRVPVGAPIYIA